MQRRQLITGAVAVTALAAIQPAWSQDSVVPDIQLVGELPPLPSDLADSAGSPPAPYSPTADVGTKPPTPEEITRATDLLKNSPFGVPPIEVAQYFLAVGAGAYGQELRPYAREWPVRANPLIFHFFSATQTKPEGDTTAWCAAFLNWCLLRSRASSADEIGRAPGNFSSSGKPFPEKNLKDHSTNSASSGSFRCWADTKTPKRGDIVVFRDPGTDDLTKVCRGTGHVAFYLGEPTKDQVRVIGGNQTLKGSNGAITVADMKTSAGSRFLKYVSLS
jgi:hypothetical protein